MKHNSFNPFSGGKIEHRHNWVGRSQLVAAGWPTIYMSNGKILFSLNTNKQLYIIFKITFDWSILDSLMNCTLCVDLNVINYKIDIYINLSNIFTDLLRPTLIHCKSTISKFREKCPGLAELIFTVFQARFSSL